MATKASRAAKAQSRPSRSRRRVSNAAMHKELASIAERHFSGAFNEMFQYVLKSNPGSSTFMRHYVRAMRGQLERDEATLRQRDELHRRKRYGGGRRAAA